MRTLVIDILLDYALRHGRFGLVKLGAKGLRLLVHWRAHRRWLRCLGGPVTRPLVRKRPRIAYRASSLYLFLGPGFVGRMAMLHAHYAFLNEVFDASGFAGVAHAGFRLWSHDGEGSSVAIHLFGPPEHREGDLDLQVAIDGVVVFRLAFSVVSCEHVAVAPTREPVICIGQVQGVAGEADRIRDATRVCEAVAPQDLLMSALAGIASAWGIGRVVGVGVERHLSAQKMSRVGPHFDYTSFWERYGAVQNAARHHVVDLPFAQRPIGEIVTRHRKRTLRKRRFKEAVLLGVALRMARGCRGDGGVADPMLDRVAALQS